MKWKYKKYIDTLLSSCYILEGLLFMSKTSPRIDDAIKGMVAFDLWCFIKITITVYVKRLTLKWVWSYNKKYVIENDIFWREMKIFDYVFVFRLFSVYIFPISYHSIKVYVRIMNDGKCWKFEFSFMIQMIITFQKSNVIVFHWVIRP